MSDGSRPRKSTTRQQPITEERDAKAARDELTRMLQRDTRDPREPRAQPPAAKRWADDFDDLPEQQRRAPISPRAAVPPRPLRDVYDDEVEYARPRVSPLADARADLHRAESLRGPGRVSSVELPLYGEMRRNPLLMVIVAAISVGVIFMLLSRPAATSISVFRDPASSSGELTGPVVAAAPAPNGEHTLVGPPTLTAAQIDTVLAEYNSPAVGTGEDWVRLGKQYGLDPAYALAFFVVESTAGTAQGWAGWKEDGSSTHNIGNIICAGYSTCHGRFRDYGSWQEGIEDWYQLIAVEYVEGRGISTVEQIIPIYAPAFENDVPAYVGNVEGMVSEWRTK